MLMSLPDLIKKYDMQVTGVLHAGAHLAEEAPIYAECGIDSVTWIEANPAVLDKIRAAIAPYPDHRLVHALLWEVDGDTRVLNITNYDGMSSSILPFGTHPEFSPDTKFVSKVELTTTTIDTIVDEHAVRANFLNMDLQGVEGWVLRGASDFLHRVDYVMSEVNCAQVYKGCTQIGELDDILDNFERVETHWVGDQGWGDALWSRR